MKLAEISKQEPPFAGARRKLRAAIEAGKITEETDASAALQLIFASDSLNLVEFVMALGEQGAEDFLPSRTVGELLWRLERLDEQYEAKQRSRDKE